MPGNNDTRYTYAVSRIRAIERKLLDRAKLDRMIEARTPEDALKVLVEADYGYASPETNAAYEYEKILYEESRKVYRLLKEVAPEPDIFNMFFLTGDYHNIRVILKAEFSGQEINEKILMESGIFTSGRMKEIIKDRTLSDLPPVMKSAVEECIDLFNRTGDPQAVDIILDRASFKHMKEIASMSENSFLKELATIMIDLVNMKIFLRVKNLKKPWDFLEKVLISGGRIDIRLYTDKLESSVDNFSEALRYTPYGALVEESLHSYKATGSLTQFEKLSDNFIISFVKKAKYVNFGIEPLVGYLIAKENEIKNIRIIMVGKINNIPNEIIRERLRETYA